MMRMRILSAFFVLLYLCGASFADDIPPTITTEALDMAVTGAEYSATLTASSNTAVTWTYTGRLPTGLTLDSSGVISGKPEKAGKFTFNVTAANTSGKTSKRFTIQVVDPVTIITASLKDATINKNYSVTMRAKGTRPFTWSAENLPDGLSINAKTGRISGKPSSSGNFTVKVSAENSAGTVTDNFSLNVKDIAPKLAGSLAKATLNEEYSSGLRLTAGTGTIIWSITGDLPTGLTFDTSTGKITGIPTSYAKSGYKLTITAKNDAGEKSKKVTLMVKGTAPKITTTKLTDATVSKTYTFTLTATGSEPITFTADELPEGLALSEGGTISGKPKKSYDAFRITVYAENPVKTVRKSLTLKINANDDSDTRLPIIRFSDGTSYTALTDEFLPENISGGYVFPLGEVSCDEAGMYDFALELPEYVREGSELVYAANSESPSDDDEIAEFFDENGNETAAVPESRKITVSIWLNEGITYKPVIIVMP